MKTNKEQYIEIDDFVVDKNTPFQIYEGFPKLDGKMSASFASKKGK